MPVTLTAMRLLASTLPAILLALSLVRTLRRFGCRDERTPFAVVALLFGTPLFAYGMLFFAHALSAFCLFGAFALLFLEGRPAAAGAFIGLAVLAEYPNVVPAAVLFACALARLSWKGTQQLLAGGLPFAIVLAIYDKLAFGSFFALSSAHESDSFYRTLAASGWFGIGVPSPAVLFRLLFDPARGLFVFSPVLLIAFLGLRGASRSMSRDAFVALIATPLSILITFAGYPNWHGGWTAGARYLVPALPFLAVLIAFASDTMPRALLLGASLTATALVSLVFPFVALAYPMPWTTLAWPLLRDGHVAPNLFHFMWRPFALAVPFVLAITAAMFAVRSGRIVWMIAGGALWFLAGFAFVPSTSPNIRSVIEEVHFEDRTAIERIISDPKTRAALEAIARDEERRPPDFHPF